VTLDAVDIVLGLVVLVALVWGVRIWSWQEGFEEGVGLMKGGE
jgi:hypothetical protein